MARLLGRPFGILAAVIICLVVAGSMLGNSFVAGRMAVAAANANWLPRAFAIVGRVGWRPASTSSSSPLSSDNHQYQQVQVQDDEVDAQASISIPSATDNNPQQEDTPDAPINAIILNAILSIFFIVLGDFRSLVTFNGLAEYTFFFLTVLGAVILRFREPGLHRPYKPLLLTPVVFTLVCGFVLIRGAVFRLGDDQQGVS
ncbi:amino acid/polyamine transporter I [Coniella lustricola]|uniref:Amino acid/polyamine transporter I n=1 Tax=Coniella lustricola TaxID=2025994 RepID=A0A2T3A5L7_9PEZI|nr:amino acid/polyamine transporter I [Coniella lustricola]